MYMKKTLLILAAGLASRYKGNKQVDSVGPNGETLMEYSIADAKRNGFDSVVFVIGQGMADSFRPLIESRISGIDVKYAIQSFDDLPDGFTPCPERKRPYGTVQALLSADGLINNNFVVINADDYYGKKAFVQLSAQLEKVTDNCGLLLAYPLGNTICDSSGPVTRGICDISPDGRLLSVKETYKIKKDTDGYIRSFFGSVDTEVLDPATPVSMNCFGFSPDIFDICRREFASFIKGISPDDLDAEYALPVMIDKLLAEYRYSINVSVTDSDWIGLTYREDRPIVAEYLRGIEK